MKRTCLSLLFLLLLFLFPLSIFAQDSSCSCAPNADYGSIENKDAWCACAAKCGDSGSLAAQNCPQAATQDPCKTSCGACSKISDQCGNTTYAHCNYNPCNAPGANPSTTYTCYSDINPNCQGTYSCGNICAPPTPAPTLPPTPRPTAAPPSCPNLGEKPSGLSYNSSTKTISWNNINGASGYNVRLVNPSGAQSNYDNIPRTWYTFPDSAVSQNGSYSWWIDAFNNCGSVTRGSSTFTINGSTPTPSPTPIPTSPSAAVTIKSILFGDKSLDINGNDLKLSLPVADPTKEQDVPIKIDVTYSDNSTKSFYLTFHYKPKQVPGEAIHLTSCQEITKPGNYVLDQDINNNSNSACIKIHDSSDVNLDCNNHGITSIDSLHNESNPGHTIAVDNVNGFSIKSCKLLTSNETSATFSIVGISNSRNGVISSSIIENHRVNVINSTSISFANNTLNGSSYGLSQTSNSVIDNNKFMLSNPNLIHKLSKGAFLILQHGSNNQVINNLFNGQSDGVLEHQIGVDDAILLGNEYNQPELSDVIKNNTILNVWDCAIETLGLVQSSTIDNNKIDNAGLCGIGGWWVNSWIGNVVTNNIINNTPSMFVLYLSPRDNLPQSTIYFKDNVFRNNKLTNQKDAINKQPTLMDFIANVPQDRLLASNNIISENDFGLTNAPLFRPEGMIVDGGNNICKQGDNKDFSLKCIGETPSQVQRVQQIIPPTIIPESPKLPSNILPQPTTSPQPSSPTPSSSPSLSPKSSTPNPSPTLVPTTAPVPSPQSEGFISSVSNRIRSLFGIQAPSPSPSYNPIPSSSPTKNPYDLNGDGVVNAADASKFLQLWRSGNCQQISFVKNGTCNVFYYLQLQQNFTR